MIAHKKLPSPYGSIPKRKKKLLPTQNNKIHTPYPFFSLKPNTTSFLTILSSLFNEPACKEEKVPVGFMPCTTPHTTQTQTSPLDIIVPANPIDCAQDYHPDACSSLSSSSSSSDSSLSSYMEDESVLSNSISTTAALSDILCDHYVQTKRNAPSSSDSELVNVPLETFRIFEAPPTEHTENWMSKEPEKEWTLIETLSKPSKRLQNMLEQEKEEEQEQEEEQTPTVHAYHHTRDIRANAAYLRMIVAEVNMMRSQKIVGPLRPRRVLPKRSDAFMHRPSPLQLILV